MNWKKLSYVKKGLIIGLFLFLILETILLADCARNWYKGSSEGAFGCFVLAPLYEEFDIGLIFIGLIFTLPLLIILLIIGVIISWVINKVKKK